MFTATVFDDGHVHIAGNGSIEKLMLSVTMIVRTIYDCDDIDDVDKEIFKTFCQEHLGKIAFKSEDELHEGAKKLKMELEEAKDGLIKLLRDVLKEVEK